MVSGLYLAGLTISVVLFVLAMAMVGLGTALMLLIAPNEQLRRPAAVNQLIQLGRTLFAPRLASSRVRQPERHAAKRYRWTFPVRAGTLPHLSRSRFSVTLSINRLRYKQYRQRQRELNPYLFDTYVTLTTPEVKMLAAKLRSLGQALGYPPYEQFCLTLAFVQQAIRYAEDLSPITNQIIEYPKYPLETLLEQCGDCEDQAILLAALLKRMGYSVALLVFPTHVALGIAGFDHVRGTYVTDPMSGMHYLYTETTASQWLPGEIPSEFQPDLARGDYDILPIGPA